MAKKEKSGEGKDKDWGPLLGIASTAQDGKFPRAEWDGNDPPLGRQSFTLYNYTLGRNEYSYGRVQEQPPEVRAHYGPYAEPCPMPQSVRDVIDRVRRGLPVAPAGSQARMTLPAYREFDDRED